MPCLHEQLFKCLIILYFVANVFFGYSLETEYIPNDWVDPSDMRNYVRHAKCMKAEDNFLVSETKLSMEKNVKYSDCENNLKRYNVFIERFINRLIKVSKLDISMEEDNISSEIVIRISSEKLRTLITLGKHFSPSQLIELDEIFSSIITKKSQYDMSYSHFWINALNSKEILTALTLSVIIIFTLWMFGTGKNMYQILCFLYLTSFLLGLLWNWWSKYQEVVVNQYVEIKKYSDMPNNCTPTKWSSIMSYLNPWYKDPEDCLRYYKANNIHPLSELKPFLIFSETFTSFFIHPINEVVKILQNLCYELASVMPWPLNLIIYPLFVLMVLIFVLSCLSLLLAKEIRIWSYLGGFIIGSGHSNKPDFNDRLSIRDNSTSVSAVPVSTSPLPVGNTFQNCSVLFTNVDKENINHDNRKNKLGNSKKPNYYRQNNRYRNKWKKSNQKTDHEEKKSNQKTDHEEKV